MAEPIQVFISYCSKDRPFLEELVKHLRRSEERGVIRLWHDQEFATGASWEKEIQARIEKAQIILFLVSVDFFNSPYCRSEVEQALAQTKIRVTTIIPVILRNCDWRGELWAEFGALPKPLVPVNTSRDRDEVWTGIAREIERVAKEVPERIKEAQSSSRQRLFRRVKRSFVALAILIVGSGALGGAVWSVHWAIAALPTPPTPTSGPIVGEIPASPGPGSRVGTKARGTQVIGGSCAFGLREIQNCACVGGGSGPTWNCDGKPQVLVHCESGRVQVDTCPRGCQTIPDHDDRCK